MREPKVYNSTTERLRTHIYLNYLVRVLLFCTMKEVVKVSSFTYLNVLLTHVLNSYKFLY